MSHPNKIQNITYPNLISYRIDLWCIIFSANFIVLIRNLVVTKNHYDNSSTCQFQNKHIENENRRIISIWTKYDYLSILSMRYEWLNVIKFGWSKLLSKYMNILPGIYYIYQFDLFLSVKYNLQYS